MLNFDMLWLLILKVGASSFFRLEAGCCWWVGK
jgi:hypothetical protein